MAGWNGLSVELRLMTFEYLCDNQNQSLRHNRHLSTYAASDFQEFKRALVLSRRRWLRRLWLQVKLQPYEIFPFIGREYSRKVEENDKIFTASIWKLFTILKEWENRDQTPCGQISLTLVLSAYTPARVPERLHSGYAHMTPFTTYAPLTPVYRCRHSSTSNCNCYTPAMYSADSRLFIFGAFAPTFQKNGIKDYSFFSLPTLHIVAGFIIPRHYYVNIPSVGIIADHLPNLQHVSIEQWRQSRNSHHDDCDLLRKILQVQPPKLQSFSAFLDTGILAASFLPRRFGESDVMSAQWLRIRSRLYSKIDVSFFVHAEHSFDSHVWELPEK
ncbi:hypothetical protein F5B19DRAFT_489118 [Rostrohypoxylon terebratum]|nr:hypothetical protein F5B19DRAFT_489118 [Rostrohypoxylon terebratum]